MKVLVSLFFVFMLSLRADAQLMTESFNYTAGDSIGAHGWTSFSGGATNRLTVSVPGLEFPGYQDPGIGNSVRLTNTGQDAYKPFSANVNSGNLYCFFIIRVDTARIVAGGGDYFVGLLPSTSTTNYTCRIYIRNAPTMSNKFAFGLTKNAISGGPVQYSDSIYSWGTDYLVCAKYTFLTGSNTDDQVSLFVFDSAPPAFEPATPTIGPATSTTTDVNDIGRFALRQALATTSASLWVDEIWVGTDWNTLLPVELTSFTSTVSGRNAELRWTTSSELNNSGFFVERRTASDAWISLAFVEGKGTTSAPENYVFVDRGLPTGNYSYRLKQVDYNGNYEYFNLEGSVSVGIPTMFSLHQNYPNPFNPSTVIGFDVPADGLVRLSLFDMQGKLVQVLESGFRSAGYYSHTLRAGNLPSGSYLYRLESGNFTASKMLVLLK